MKTLIRTIALSAFGALLLSAAPLEAQYQEAATADMAGQVLGEIMAIPVWQVPASLLHDAQGIAILPDLVKGSFIVGVRHGRGVVVVRDEAGRWQPPVFISMTGGSVGWQIGLQATDVILVFKTRSSVKGLMSGKFTLGADAAVAAGPVGRQAAAATDPTLRAEIYSYSRSRGLFLGVSLDGSVIQIDRDANVRFYGGAGALPTAIAPGQAILVPPSAARLLDQIGRFTAPPPAAAAVVGAAPVGAVAIRVDPKAELEQSRRQLADASLRLYAVVDNNWKTYLALPGEVYAGDRPISTPALSQSLGKFDAVVRDPRYQNLTQRSEFRTAHELLRRQVNLQTAQTGQTPTLALPQPPQQNTVR
jgi:lipid-binding SYLF domain-containing protein